MDIVVVANPENRRATFFEEAATGRDIACRVLPWADVLRGAPVDGEHIRIESPGENWEVENLLLDRKEPEDRGLIRGLAQAQGRFADVLSTFPRATYFTPPAAIAAMFDKVESKRRLANAGLDVPRTWGTTRSFEELRAIVDAHGHRCFVKPRHGSSASGVIALTMSRDRVLAVTSVERVERRLYNSLKIRRYTTFADVAAVVDLLGAEDELLVEEWVPKASAQGATYDLRVVAIDDAADHAVMRLSRSPMTNLHLGNARGDVEALCEQLGSRWGEVQQKAVRALAAFDGALYAGVDIALSADARRITTFEVNAFGDLLPGVTDARGRSTYAAELDAFMAGTRSRS